MLLQNTDYDYAAQVNILDLFARTVSDNLGVVNNLGECWKSYMTDGNNIELSWDWHTGIEKPAVRFSIDPIGMGAGMTSDPRNGMATAKSKESILQALPNIDMSWFNHFETFFRGETESTFIGLESRKKCDLAECHASKVFWTFDLGEKDITSKAYFFPGYRARAMNRSNLQVISEAIISAPSCTPERLDALTMFSKFVHEHERMGRSPLRLDMLAVDMVESSSARLKIYFYSRRTDFRSVCENMTLRGRIAGPDMDRGLSRLRCLWESLFDQEGVSPDTPLSSTSHQTAGILYDVEFRLGDKAPKTKIYMPVQHYARTDAQVITSVSKFMNAQGIKHGGAAKRKIGCPGREQAPSARLGPSLPTPSYADAFNAIFTDEAIRSSRGRHTRVACSIEAGGALRVVSYANPQEGKFIRHTPQQSS
ncbi:aromatic prenyltransferase [Annulohypoxylon maeteangense]|uniref:aromatic prenyltransferase n=1 Tax=Annulohypoxylon maeteangense TaxID=1927788 RepID=UPI002008A832|nr:aromatic prenyltransferase [Annulohypoxylon maeteangense]KAI0888616.1 aromatic prenyltransferase [Annulohypoxylon maeteangense]